MEHGPDLQLLEFDALTGDVMSWIVWFLFGAILVTGLGGVTWRSVVFALLALTIVRMGAVALSLAGTGWDRITVLFVGWFGPRGLASVVFGLLAFDALPGETGDVIVAAIMSTVIASVVLHGLTASPLIRRYGTRLAGGRPEPAPEME